MLHTPTYGKVCVRCSTAIRIHPGEAQLCEDCQHEEAAARRIPR
jgi:NMD protein affecting ribosome stability and mRNA decay